jgi:hypothetical protein
MEDDSHLDEVTGKRQGATSKRLAPARALLKRLSAHQSPAVSRRERLVIGLSMAVFVSVAVAVAVHLDWAHRHMRPKLQLTEDLHVVTPSSLAASAGLAGYRVVAANGQAVADLDQLDAAIEAAGPRILLTEAVAVRSGESKSTIWSRS